MFDTFFQALAKIILNVYYSSRFLIGAIAILCLGICGFKYVRADNQQEVSKVKNWAIGIIIGLVIFFAAPFVITTLNSVLGNGGQVQFNSNTDINTIMK